MRPKASLACCTIRLMLSSSVTSVCTAASLGRPDDAMRHLSAALVANEQMRARPWVAHTQRDYAKLLLAQGEPGEREIGDAPGDQRRGNTKHR